MSNNKEKHIGQLYKNKVNVIAPKNVEMDTFANGRVPAYVTYQNNNIVSVTDILKNYPIPLWYHQYDDGKGNFLDAESPSNYYNKVFKLNTTWDIKFNSESVFFRTEGSYSNSGRSSGFQNDAIRNLTGRLVIYAWGICRAEGIFYPASSGTQVPNPYNSLPGYDNAYMDASRIVSTASENRVKNRLVRIYKLSSINGIQISTLLGA